VPYVMPQENGNKCDVRWLSLRSADGFGILVVGQGLLEASVRHYTDQDLYRAFHSVELARRAEVYLHLDHAQSGLGNASCGFGYLGPLPEYLVRPGTHEFGFVLRPFTRNEGEETMLYRAIRAGFTA